MAGKDAMTKRQRAILIILLLIMISGFALSFFSMFAEGLYAMIIGIIGYFLYNTVFKNKI